jgi:hypothetical protein
VSVLLSSPDTAWPIYRSLSGFSVSLQRSVVPRSTLGDMATTYTPHLRLSFGGTLGSTVPEQWSNTLRFHVVGNEPTRDQLVNACAATIQGLTSWFRSSGARHSSQAHLAWVKLNWIGADGRQRDADTVQFDLLVPADGYDNQFIPPYYQTFAITLRTRTSRGRGHSGRIFPPMVTYGPELGTPYATPQMATAMATAFVTMIREIRSAMALTWQDSGVGLPDLAVMSAGDSTRPNRPALWTPVIAAVVDRTPDVQHRRTNRVPRAEGTTVLLDP